MTLFARSFLLIALLVLASVAGWFGILHTYQREPVALELANQTVSIVNLTRAALVNADPQRRRGLLHELSYSEGIRVYAATSAEKLAPLPQEPVLTRIAQQVRAALGERTRLAWARDGVEGFWVSFFIAEDEFWIALPRERVEPDAPWQWLGWGGLTLLASLLAAWLIASHISGPLARLARAAQVVGGGDTPAPLAEQGARELRTVAAAFNRMASDLVRAERERATVLAGISHDLRTPLARLRLALEMTEGEREVLSGMAADVDEIDQVIGQFLDFARGEGEERSAQDLDRLVRELVERYAQLGKPVHLDAASAAGTLRLAPLSVRRAITNLINNALRHGESGVELRARRAGAGACVEVLDRGPGIPPAETERLKRPFARLDAARGTAGGAGLGLAIAERVAQAHGGRLELLARDGGGLRAQLWLGSE